MPHLLIRGVRAEQLQTAALPLIEQLAELCDCGIDNFTLNCLHTTSVIADSPDSPSFAFVEVGWFERGQSIRSRFAQIVTRTIMKLGFEEVEIVFVAYREDCYYVNGSAVKP